VIQGIYKVVNGLIDAINAKDQKVLRQTMDISLQQLDSLMQSSDAA